MKQSLSDYWNEFVNKGLAVGRVPREVHEIFRATFYAGAAAYSAILGKHATELEDELEAQGEEESKFLKRHKHNPRSATPPHPDPSEQGAGAPKQEQ